MKKFIFSLICFFACAGLQARITHHQSDFDQKVPLEAFSENPQNRISFKSCISLKPHQDNIFF